MKRMLIKRIALVMTLILLMSCFGIGVPAAAENLLADLNADFEGDKPLTVQQSGQIIDAVAHTGKYSLAMPADGYIKYAYVPVKAKMKYTLSFWMQNSAQDAIKFWAANNGFLQNGYPNRENGVPYGSLPDMTFGEAHTGEDILVWREVKFSFIVPDGANEMHIAINANADDEFLVVDDIVLVEEELVTTSNLFGAVNPDFEGPKMVNSIDLNGSSTDKAGHSGTKSFSMTGGYIKLYNFPVKANAVYTLSFWIQNSKANAVRFYAANNRFKKDGYLDRPNGAAYGSLPDMMFGEAHEENDITWREISLSFVVPEEVNMMDIAINANPEVLDEALLVDDISLVETQIAASDNLFAQFNPDFEGPQTVTTIDLNGSITDKAAYSGTKSFSMPTGYVKFWRFPVKPLTNYTLSFQMQNSKADAVRFYSANNGFYKDGYDTREDGTKYGSLPDMVFGEAHEGTDIAWREVRVNFTTPTDVNMMNIAINANTEANGEDPYLLLDDLSFVETGKDFGVITNGDFEEAIIPGTLQGWSGASYTIHTEAETGNKYITSSTGCVEYPGGVWGALTGKRIKISLKSYGAKPWFRFYKETKIWEYQNDGNAGPFFGLEASADTWETYTLYIDATKVKNAGDNLTAPLWIYATKIDDVYIGEDKNEIGFYKVLDFRNKEGDLRHYTPVGATSDGNWANSFTSEKSIPVDTLSEITADDDGYKSVSARAHVIPVEVLNENGVGTGTYEKTEVMLFTGVYRYENGKKSLVDFDVKSESSTDGKVLDPVTTVKVPADTEGVTYKVEAMTWNTAQGMQPVCFDKAILQ